MTRRILLFLDNDEFMDLLKMKQNKTWKELLVDERLKKRQKEVLT